VFLALARTHANQLHSLGVFVFSARRLICLLCHAYANIRTNVVYLISSLLSAAAAAGDQQQQHGASRARVPVRACGVKFVEFGLSFFFFCFPVLLRRFPSLCFIIKVGLANKHFQSVGRLPCLLLLLPSIFFSSQLPTD
jgi:hypothetical protein